MTKQWTLLHGNLVEKLPHREGPTLCRAVYDIEEAHHAEPEEEVEQINIVVMSSNHMGSVFWNGQNELDLCELRAEERDRLRDLIVDNHREGRCTFSLIATGKNEPSDTWLLLNLAKPTKSYSQVGSEDHWHTWMFDENRINTKFTYSQIRMLRDALDQMNLLYFRI